MRRALRWVKRIVLGTIATVLVIVIAVLIILHTDWGRDKARRIALSQLQALFPGGIHADRIDGSVLGDIELTNVTINGFDKKRMIRAGKVRTNLKISALFTKTIELEFVDVDDVEVADPSNPVKLKEDDEEGNWSVEMPRIHVGHAKFTLTGAQPMTFEDLDVIAGLHIPAHQALTASTTVKGRWKERDLPFDVRAEAEVGDAITVPSLKVIAGDTTITGTKLLVDAARSTGTLAIHATPAVVAKFAPTVVLPAAADVDIAITRPKESRVDLSAKLGTATVVAVIEGDADTKHARGMLAADGVDLATFLPSLPGHGDGVLGFTVDPSAAHATVLVRGQLLDLPAGHALVGVDATTGGARAMLIAGGKGKLGTAAVGQLRREGTKLQLVDARVLTSVGDASAATAGQVPLAGPISVGGNAKGSLAPVLDIELAGYVSGTALHSTDPKLGGLAIASLDGSTAASITAAGVTGRARVTASKVSRGGSPLGTFVVDARSRGDRKIVANVKAFPAAIQAVAELDTTITLPATETAPLAIELGKHSVHAGRINWGGSGGSILITNDDVKVRDIKSTSGAASLAIDATITKATGAIEIKAIAKDVPMGTIDPTYAGTVTANVDMKRRGILWNGKTTITAAGIKLGDDKPAIDGTVALTVANRRVTADISAQTFQIGGVRFVVDVDGPADITDPVGWRRLERSAIRTALVGLTRIDLAAVKVPTGGVVDGELVLSGMDSSGQFTVKAVQTPIGSIDGEVNFARMGDEVGASSALRIENFGDAQVTAQIAIPPHPFEPQEWKRLGRGVVRVLTASAEDIVIDPAKLAKLGIVTPYHGRASVQLALAAGASEARAKIDLREVGGGKLLKPVDVLVEAAINAQQTTAGVQARFASKAEWTDADKRLIKVSAALPAFSFDRWLAAASTVLDAPLEGRIEFPGVDIPAALAMIGRVDITTGKLDGGIDVKGTVRAPTASGELVITNVNIKPRLAGRKLPTLDELRIGATWGGAGGEVTIKGRESDKATLDITARGNPKEPDKTFVRAVIKKFDVAPVAVFLPGPLVAATGKLSADITVTGLGVDKVRGSLALEKGRVPIHPQVGTIRDANLNVKLSDLGLDYKLTAKLGAGSIDLNGDAPPDLSNLTIRGGLDKVSPIGEIQPVVSTKIAGTMYRDASGIHGDVKLKDTSVSLDMEQGVKLLEDKMPEDLFIGQATAPPPTPKTARLPRKPWFTVTVALESTPVTAKHEFMDLRARVNANKGITLSVGRTLGMDGSIEIERGDVDVLGRSYRIDPGPDRIRFDGTVDPLLNIRLVHEFPELTLTADIGGRATKRDINMTGTPNRFTQDELFAFFLGADPGGAADSTTRDAASNAAAALLSAKLGRRVKKVLPVKIDVLNCDAGSSSSGATCQAGKWLTENWFVALRQRLEPRADEDPQELQLRYFFRRNWMFEGTGSNERFGGDVLWRKRW